MVHFELKMGKLKEGQHRLMVLVQNVILVLGPGRASEWHFEAVKSSKAKTIKLASKMIEAFAARRLRPFGGLVATSSGLRGLW